MKKPILPNRLNLNSKWEEFKKQLCTTIIPNPLKISNRRGFIYIKLAISKVNLNFYISLDLKMNHWFRKSESKKGLTWLGN